MQTRLAQEEIKVPAAGERGDVSTAPRTALHRWLRSVVPGRMGLAWALTTMKSPSTSSVNHLAAGTAPSGASCSSNWAGGVQLFQARGQHADCAYSVDRRLASSGLSRISARRALLMARRASETVGTGGQQAQRGNQLFGQFAAWARAPVPRRWAGAGFSARILAPWASAGSGGLPRCKCSP